MLWKLDGYSWDILSPAESFPSQAFHHILHLGHHRRLLGLPEIYTYGIAMLRIHDILVWIQIRGPMPLTNGFGSGSCYFRHWPSRGQQNTTGSLKKNFCLLLFEGTFTFTSFFKDKMLKRSHKTVGRKQGFSFYFCLIIEGSGSIPLTNGSGSGSRRP